MKKLVKFIDAAIPHLTLALGLTLLVLAVTDRFNRAMAFIDNMLTKNMLLVFLVLVIMLSVVTIARNHQKAPAVEKEDVKAPEEKAEAAVDLAVGEKNSETLMVETAATEAVVETVGKEGTHE